MCRGSGPFEMVLGDVGYPTNGGVEAKVEVPWIEEEVKFFTGSFRENVHAFLDRFAVRDASECERGVHGHSIILRSEESGITVELRVMVEVVERSKRIHCDQCKCIGTCKKMVLLTRVEHPPLFVFCSYMLTRAVTFHWQSLGDYARCQAVNVG
eukprot:1185311-Prorocentrum_minimum.AAC.3